MYADIPRAYVGARERCRSGRLSAARGAALMRFAYCRRTVLAAVTQASLVLIQIVFEVGRVGLIAYRFFGR